MPFWVKICCIQNLDEALMAIDYGASALGLVSQMPSGPGPIEDSKIKTIAANIPSNIESFLLTSRTQADGIVEQYVNVRTTAIQLVDEVPLRDLKKLREMLPDVLLVQVIHVEDESAVDEAKKVEEFVDRILLDSGRPKEGTKILGGTGNTHNWEISKKIVDEIKIPVILAGGLNPSNVVEAIETVRPYGVDLCSGLRSNISLEMPKLKEFFENVKSVEL